MWEKRTMETLKERETEHKRAASLADKAAKAESDAEAAEAEAQARLDEAHTEMENKEEMVRAWHLSTAPEHCT